MRAIGEENYKMRFQLMIKKRSQPEWLIWAVIVFPFIFGCLIDGFHFPNVVKYSLDVAWLGLLVLMIVNSRVICWENEKIPIWWLSVFVIYTIIIYFLRYQSALFYLWGARNNFRYYVVFLSFIAFLSYDEVEYFLDMFDTAYWINAAVTLFQFFILAKKGDYLGGIFGTSKGVNQYTNILLVIVVSKAVLMYIDRKKSLVKCVAIVLTAVLVAACAEIKVFFVELFIIVCVAVMFTNFSWRKMAIVIGGGLCLVGGASVLTQIFADGDLSTMSLENMLKIVTSERGYTSSGDLNRFTAIVQINDRIFESWDERIFGLGLGNCDTSGFEILRTPFYNKYSYLRYAWFSVPMVYLETGYLGLIFYYGFFVICLYQARKRLKEDKGNKLFCQMGMIMSILCCLLALYNSSLRTEAGYMAYFILSLPFIRTKQTQMNRYIEK